MTGEAHWLTLLVLFASALGIVILFFFAARLSRRFRLTRRKFECPVLHENVDATLIQDAKTGLLTSAQTCSHFVNPGEVICEQKCVASLNAAAAADRGRARPVPAIATAASKARS